MKKILVVLLVLAVAGGVFAQEGTWSVSGTVEIGTYIDFDNVPEKQADGSYVNDEPAMVRSSGYHAPYDYYDPLNGSFGIGYSLGGLSAGVSINSIAGIWGGSTIFGEFAYDGENFKFQATSHLDELIQSNWNVEKLWGYYKLLNGLIHLEAAYNSRDINGVFWTSDTTGGFFVDGNYLSPITGVWGKENDAMRLPGNTFSGNSHGNYLLANVELENLNFGVLIPKLFWDQNVHGANASYNKFRGKPSYADPKDRDYQADAWFPKALGSQWDHPADQGHDQLLVADVLKHMVFGVKFQMQPVEFAAQFLVDDYAVYFGGKVFFGALTIGASFMGIMSPTDPATGDRIDENIIRVGGSLDYAADAFGAGLSAWLGVLGDKTARNDTQIGIEPWFFYNVIPTHLQFRADVGFYFNNAYNGSEKDTEASTIVWALQPQLFWNFLGTGAGSYWSFNTGMIVRYRMVKEANNALDVTFRFAF